MTVSTPAFFSLSCNKDRKKRRGSVKKKERQEAASNMPCVPYQQDMEEDGEHGQGQDRTDMWHCLLAASVHTLQLFPRL